MGAYFGGGIIFWSNCTLSADPQLLCIFSWLLLALLVATPRNWLNASVVRFTRTFSEPIRRKPRSFSACSTNDRVTALQSLLLPYDVSRTPHFFLPPRHYPKSVYQLPIRPSFLILPFVEGLLNRGHPTTAFPLSSLRETRVGE